MTPIPSDSFVDLIGGKEIYSLYQEAGLVVIS
jgi:hypothetical protein